MTACLHATMFTWNGAGAWRHEVGWMAAGAVCEVARRVGCRPRCVRLGLEPDPGRERSSPRFHFQMTVLPLKEGQSQRQKISIRVDERPLGAVAGGVSLRLAGSLASMRPPSIEGGSGFDMSDGNPPARAMFLRTGAAAATRVGATSEPTVGSRAKSAVRSRKWTAAAASAKSARLSFKGFRADGAIKHPR